MPFTGGQCTWKKTKSVGRTQKKGKTYHEHQIASAAAILAGLGDPNPAAELDPVDPTPVKKQRSDNNWRVDRAIRSRDKQAAKNEEKLGAVSMERDSLSNGIFELESKVLNQKATIKKLQRDQFVVAKAHRIAGLEKEEAHKAAIQVLVEEYAQKIDDAFEYADKETNKKLEAEKAKILADSQYSTNLKKERQRHFDKLKKERKVQASMKDQAHQRWINNLARNLSSQQRLHDLQNERLQKKVDHMKMEIKNERKFNQYR